MLLLLLFRFYLFFMLLLLLLFIYLSNLCAHILKFNIFQLFLFPIKYYLFIYFFINSFAFVDSDPFLCFYFSFVRLSQPRKWVCDSVCFEDSFETLN